LVKHFLLNPPKDPLDHRSTLRSLDAAPRDGGPRLRTHPVTNGVGKVRERVINEDAYESGAEFWVISLIPNRNM